MATTAISALASGSDSDLNESNLTPFVLVIAALGLLAGCRKIHSEATKPKDFVSV